ncbi:MAG: CsbD family protein [Dongiaceae bacterium]
MRACIELRFKTGDTIIDKNRIDGSLKQAAGSIQEAAGKVTNDPVMQANGAVLKAEGKTQRPSAT